MAQISPVELFIALFIGMGPIKVLLIYIAMTEGMSREVRRRMARRIVLVAGSVGIALFIFGAILQAILHFSIGALTIFGGLILLILALTMVLGGGRSSSAEHGDTDPMSLATSPLAIPLTLNPVGIVMLVVASVEVDSLADTGLMIAIILIIMAIDLVVLYGSDRVAKYFSHAAVELLERVLGILLGALAVQLILVGLSEVGLITLAAH